MYFFYYNDTGIQGGVGDKKHLEKVKNAFFLTTINCVTALDPYVISQYASNFALGMQEGNDNKLATDGGYSNSFKVNFQVYENGCNL